MTLQDIISHQRRWNAMQMPEWGQEYLRDCETCCGCMGEHEIHCETLELQRNAILYRQMAWRLLGTRDEYGNDIEVEVNNYDVMICEGCGSQCMDLVEATSVDMGVIQMLPWCPECIKKYLNYIDLPNTH